ncbi:MAG TPA: HNH endonuclease [Candidatus Bathyarchaeia archaeon]|nr:HNH endonuclease [Candidatus Bathyarchaeia archaeon]
MKPTREEYREQTEALHKQVIGLAWVKGLLCCERCGEWTPQVVGHMHHTLGGSGRRRQQQSIENVAWLCGTCHRALHREPAAAREFRERLKILRQHPEHRREPQP